MQRLRELFYRLLRELNIPYRRYFFDRVDFDEKLIGVLGDRGIGKTTFLLQYLKDSPLDLREKLYINAEYLSLSNLDLFKLAESFQAEGGKLLVIDEVHKYPDFERHLKLIYDFFDLKVIFSGSSAIKLEHAKADLSRRAMLYRFQGLSFREYLELKIGQSFPSYPLEELLQRHETIAYELTERFKPLEHFSEYLAGGYYPFCFENSEENFYLKLNEAINATIEFDLSHIFNIEPKFTIKLKQLVALICQSQPYELNISRLAQKIGINRNTLYQYIYYLERGNIFYLLHAKSKGESLFSKPQKLYLDNTNLHYAYCETIEKGTIRETFFTNQLKEMHSLRYPPKGDFLVDETYLFEIGGKSKGFGQISEEENAYVVADDIEIGHRNKLPLWLFGFLY